MVTMSVRPAAQTKARDRRGPCVRRDGVRVAGVGRTGRSDAKPAGRIPAGFFMSGGEGAREGRGVFGATGYTGRELVRLLGGASRAREVAFTTGSGDGHLAHEAGLEQEADAYLLALPHGISADLRGAAAPERPARGRDRPLGRPAAAATPPRTARGTATITPRPRCSARRPTGCPRSTATGSAARASSPTPAATRRRCCCRWCRCCADGLVDPTTSWWTPRAAPPAPAARLREDLLFCEVADDFSAYAPGRTHRHVGEMEAVLEETHRARRSRLTFCPHLLPVKRGILSRSTCARSGRPSELRARARRVLRGRAVRARGGDAAPPLRRGGHERVPDLRPRRRARARGRVLGARQPGEGRRRPGHPEPEPGRWAARRRRACPWIA